MSARQVIVPGAMPSRDANGRALPAKFRFYLPSSGGVPTTVYTDNTLSVPHPFPLLSDDAGRWPSIWADDALSFDVGWTDQVFDEIVGGPFTGVKPANDAVLASVGLAQAAADLAVASEALAAAYAAAAAASASGIDVFATSSSALNFALGSQNITLDQTGKDFAPGQHLIVTSIADRTKYLLATVASVADPIITATIASFVGAGSASSWDVALTPIGGVQSVAGLTGVIAASALATALNLVASNITDFSPAVDLRAINAGAAMAIALGRRR